MWPTVDHLFVTNGGSDLSFYFLNFLINIFLEFYKYLRSIKDILLVNRLI